MREAPCSPGNKVVMRYWDNLGWDPERAERRVVLILRKELISSGGELQTQANEDNARYTPKFMGLDVNMCENPGRKS